MGRRPKRIAPPLAAKALRRARKILADERRSQWESFTVPPHKDTPAAWAAMNFTERWVIRRFDRAISAIDDVLQEAR